MSQFEAEWRSTLAQRWTATVFGGVACTYGDGKNCTTSTNIFSNGRCGRAVRPEAGVGIVMSLEFAQGKDREQGAHH
jgi:hypothetical protein